MWQETPFLGVFCLPRLVSEKAEGSVQEVHDCSYRHEGDNERQKCLQET